MTENNSTPIPVSYDLGIVLVSGGCRINQSFSYTDEESAQKAFDDIRFGYGTLSQIEFTTPDGGTFVILPAYLVAFQLEPMFP